MTVHEAAKQGWSLTMSTDIKITFAEPTVADSGCLARTTSELQDEVTLSKH